MKSFMRTPKNFVELSAIVDFASFGVPLPETIKTIFCFDLSQFTSHFGRSTARRGKNTASIKQPVLESLWLP
jgi:hypothetical protein